MATEPVPIDVLARYFRVPTGGLPVDYQGREPLLTASVTNVSIDGVFVSTPKPLPPETMVRVEFILPSTPPIEIAAEAVVRWAVGVDASGLEHRPKTAALSKDVTRDSGMGLEFVSIRPAQKRAIEAFVREFLERMRT